VAERRAVVFDLDDTLYRERRFVLSGLRGVARAIEARHGVPAADTWRVMTRHFRHEGRAALLQAVCRAQNLPLQEIPGWVARIRSHTPDLRLPRGSVAILRRVRAEGYRVGILTNGLPDTQRAKVRALGLRSLVDAIVYADEHADGGKPHVACFAAVLSALRVSPADAVFVGDHLENDIEGARAAGMRTIWLSVPFAPRPSGAHVVVSSLDAVPSALRLLKEPHAHAC
jgi:putative hydrolase of the HAD superfamily